MKKMRILVLMVLILLCVSGCTSNVSTDTSTNTSKPVHDISYTTIFVDYETNVMYTWYKSGYGAGMSVMLNADGTPKLYDETSSKYTNVYDITYTTIFVDYETNVMYTWYKSGYGAGMSVMLNADGTPKLYDETASKYTNIYDITYTTIFVDYETNVMYTWYKSGYGAGMSVMLNADGLSKLHN